MFIGHAATGFAAKRLAPSASLPWLLAAPWLLDLLWPVFLLTGFEHVRIVPGTTAFTPLDFTDYPWSHSLLMALVWGALFGLAYRTVTRDARGAWVVGALYIAGFALYLGATRGRGVAGIVAPWSLGLALAGIYALDVVAPPPKAVAPIAWVTLAFGAVVVLWSAWVERARPARAIAP